MREKLLIPKPKFIKTSGEILRIGEAGDYCFEIDSTNDFFRNAQDVAMNLEMILKEFLGEVNTYEDKSIHYPVVQIKLILSSDAVNETEYQTSALCNPEGYYLEVLPDKIILLSASKAGAMYALETLKQLFYWEGNTLCIDCCAIEDWPDIKHRGLYIDNFLDTEWMTMENWKEVIDYMAYNRFNFLSFGLIGCWSMKYDYSPVELVMVKLDKYPQLKTESNYRYFSPNSGWKTGSKLPEMYEKDFFGDLISYAKTKNVLVRPEVNTLGHNTLIPRMFPQTSAMDEEGKPTGYGFCISNQATYDTLFDIFDEIIDKHLTPNGIEWFHIGMDEVNKGRGIDINDPYKCVDPWCKCPECASKNPSDLIIDHIIKISKYLKRKGIKNITLWHDELKHLGCLDGMLGERLKDEGLEQNIVLDWWNYNEHTIENSNVFSTTRTPDNLRSFITPMTGFYHFAITENRMNNIENMMKIANNDHVEGVEAYAYFDYSYDRATRYLCELSWNSWNNAQDMDSKEYSEYYIKKYYDFDTVTATQAFKKLDEIIVPVERLHREFLSVFTYFWYAGVKQDKEYPRNFLGEVIKTMNESWSKYNEMLRKYEETGREAYELFKVLSEQAHSNIRVTRSHKVDCLYFHTISRYYLLLRDINVTLSQDEFWMEGPLEKEKEFEKMIKRLEQMTKGWNDLAFQIESNKPAWNIPLELRHVSIYRQYCVDLVNCLRSYILALKNNRDIERFDLMDTKKFESTTFKMLR